MTARKAMMFAIAIVSGTLALYLGSPYWTLYQIRSAAASGEGEKVANYVDFSAVRESIKTQFAAATAKRIESKGKDSAFAAVGQAFALRMMDGLVDAMVTPASVAAMIRSGKAPRPAFDSKAAAAPANPSDRQEPAVRRGFEGLNTFHAALVDPATKEDLLTAVLTRQGFVTWKLTAVEIPSLHKP